MSGPHWWDCRLRLGSTPGLEREKTAPSVGVFLANQAGRVLQPRTPSLEASPAKRRHLREKATMARRAAEAALETPDPKTTTHRVRTTAQLDHEARALCERRKFSHQAARWAFENKKGSRAACNSGLFGDPAVVTRNIVEPLLRQLKETEAEAAASASRPCTAQ